MSALREASEPDASSGGLGGDLTAAAHRQLDIREQRIDCGLIRQSRGALDALTREERRKQLDEVDHVALECRVATKADPGRAAWKEPTSVNDDEIFFAIRRHRRDDSDAEPHADVGLDDVRVARGEHDLRMQSLR